MRWSLLLFILVGCKQVAGFECNKFKTEYEQSCMRSSRLSASTCAAERAIYDNSIKESVNDEGQCRAATVRLLGAQLDALKQGVR